MMAFFDAIEINAVDVAWLQTGPVRAALLLLAKFGEGARESEPATP